MPETLSRRTLLRALLAVSVVGFDIQLRSWATESDLADSAGTLADGFPTFDGQLLTDVTSLDAAADDFGHIVHRRPMAVLLPGSVQDVVNLVLFARRYRIHVSARGQGHSTQGQAQTEAGVVIDMSSLATIHEVNATHALVDAGVRWLDLLEQTIPQGLTPPTLTDFLELSIGGTLSVGGIGSQAFRFGPQVDNVLELQVVTGRGHLVTCSPHQQPDLFHTVLAGLGQFGIIVSTRVRLIEALPNARLYQALYNDLALFLADLEQLVDDGRFDTVQGFAVPDGEHGGWLFQLETTKYFASGTEPDNAALLAGLEFMPGTASSQDMSYFDYLKRLEPLVAFLKQIDVWSFPHPWVNLFVPASQAVTFIDNVLAHLTVADVGQGSVAIYPYNRAQFRTPFFRVPDARHFFLFALLRNAVPPTLERAQGLIAANRQLFEQVSPLGGKRYPIDSVPMTQGDWQQHFQPLWDIFTLAKRLYDPDNILTPGQGIF